MSDLSVHFSSASNEWQTPPWLFARLNSEFSFDLDAASTKENAKCARYFTAEMDALKQDWGASGTNVFVNPPYGRLGPKFIKKAHEETQKNAHLTVVFLIPARPDTRWWHDYCAQGEIRFLKGRLGFINPALPSYKEGGDFKVSPAPFPSAIVILGKRARRGQVYHVDYKPDDEMPAETVTIPTAPPEGLLESMAIRYDHAFGINNGDVTDEQIEAARRGEHVEMGVDAVLSSLMASSLYTTRERAAMLTTMKQVHEEVVGKGFYKYDRSP